MEISMEIIKEHHSKLSSREYNKYYDSLDKSKVKDLYRVICACGGKYTPKYKYHHIKTTRHKEYLQD